VTETLTGNDMDNTIIVYSSDNGGCHLSGGYNYPLRGGKHFLWEGGTRVHSFVHYQQLPQTAKGGVYKGLMHISDWLPTLLSATGIGYNSSSDGHLDGVDQWDNIRELNRTSPRTSLIYNIDRWETITDNDTGLQHLSPMHNIRAAGQRNGFKLIMNEYGTDWYSPHKNYSSVDLNGGIQNCATTPVSNISNFLFLI